MLKLLNLNFELLDKNVAVLESRSLNEVQKVYRIKEKVVLLVVLSKKGDYQWQKTKNP